MKLRQWSWWNMDMEDLLMRSENNQSVPREEHLPFIICSDSSRYHSAGSERNLWWMRTHYASISSPLAAIPAKMLANSSTVFAWEIGYHHRQRSHNGLVSVWCMWVVEVQHYQGVRWSVYPDHNLACKLDSSWHTRVAIPLNVNLPFRGPLQEADHKRSILEISLGRMRGNVGGGWHRAFRIVKVDFFPQNWLMTQVVLQRL